MKKILSLVLSMGLANAVMPLDLAFFVINESCNGNDGSIIATAVGSNGPFTYSWLNGPQTAEYTGLTSGDYEVTATDTTGAFVTGIVTVGYYEISDTYLESNIFTEGVEACYGACTAGFRLYLPRIQGGYTFITSPPMTYHLTTPPPGSIPPVDNWELYEFVGACPGASTDLTVNPSTWCQSGHIVLDQFVNSPTPGTVIQEVTGSCTTGDDGSMTVELSDFTSFVVGWRVFAVDDNGIELTPPGTAHDWFNFGTDTVQFVGLHPGAWTLELRTNESGGSIHPTCITSVPFTIPDLGTACGSLSGTVHFETDLDCVQDGAEVGIPNQMIRLMPGPLYAITNAMGMYSVAVPFGNYTVEQVNPSIVQLCPTMDPVDVAILGGTPNVVLDFADSLLTPFDMSIHLWAGPARLGQVLTYHIDVNNLNGHPGEDVTVTINYDPLFTFVSASPGLTTNDPGNATWTLPVLDPFAYEHFHIQVAVPTDVGLIGTVYGAYGEVTSTTSELELANNLDLISHPIIAAYDPNDKTAFTSTGLSEEYYFLDIDEHIDYMIRFQNTGNDTAFFVTITDTLSTSLDMASLQILGGSHPFTTSIRDGLVGGGDVLAFKFANILLPDSTTNEPASHGYVAFRIKLDQSVLDVGVQIPNEADIFFDVNPPIRTNTSILTTEFSVGVEEVADRSLMLYPVPVTDLLTIRSVGTSFKRVRILGTDGREVARYQGATALDVSQLTAGVYVLIAELMDGAIMKARFVKQ